MINLSPVSLLHKKPIKSRAAEAGSGVGFAIERRRGHDVAPDDGAEAGQEISRVFQTIAFSSVARPAYRRAISSRSRAQIQTRIGVWISWIGAGDPLGPIAAPFRGVVDVGN